MKHQSVTKHFLEVRFQPLPTILDKRGMVTETLLSELFDFWNINQNRIDIVSTGNKNISAYVTYANYGLISESPNTSELFIEQAQELIKKIWTIIPSNRTLRVGIRTFHYFSEKKSFDTLLRLYKNHFLSIPDKRLKVFNSTLADIGIALNFDGEGNTKFNINTGAMQKEQAKQFFADHSLLPEVGIFTDTDFFNESHSQLSTLKQRDFLNLVTQGVNKAKSVQSIVTETLNDK